MGMLGHFSVLFAAMKLCIFSDISGLFPDMFVATKSDILDKSSEISKEM